MDFNKALVTCEPLLRRIVSKYVTHRPAQIADEITQSARIKLWMALAAFDAAKGSLGAYARTVITNAVKDELRRLRSERHPLTLLEADHPHRDADPESIALANAIRQTPSDYLPPCLVKILIALQSHPSPGAAAVAISMKRATFYVMTHRLKRRIQAIFAAGRLRPHHPIRKAA